jgi:hypothetical protein
LFHLINSESNNDNKNYDYIVDGFSPFFNRPGVEINPQNPLHLVYIHPEFGAIGAARLFSSKEMSLAREQIKDVGLRADDRIWECNRIVFFDKVVKRYVQSDDELQVLKKKFYDDLYEKFRSLAKDMNLNVILSVHAPKDHHELVRIANWPFLFEKPFKYPGAEREAHDILGILPIF